MRYVAAIVLENFYTSVISKADGRPTILHRGRKVLDACSVALGRGIYLGMPLAEARAVLSGEGHFAAWEEERYRHAQRRWLRIAAEYSDVVEPLDQHEALVDLTGHPRPREAAERMREALTERIGLTAKVGLGSCRWVARVATDRPDHLGQAHSDPANYISALPVSRLPIDPQHARELDLLGYRAAGDLAGLDEAQLRRLFGPSSLGIVRASRGEGDAQVQAAFPPDSVAGRFVFEGGPVDDRRSLDLALEAIAADLGESLVTGDRVGKKLELFLEFEDGTVERRRRAFSRPLASKIDLVCAAHLMLPQDPERPPEAVRLRLPELIAASRVQLDLQGEKSKKDRESSVASAVDHVRSAFGDRAVIIAGEKPEPRWVKVRRAYQEANGYLWYS